MKNEHASSKPTKCCKLLSVHGKILYFNTNPTLCQLKEATNKRERSSVTISDNCSRLCSMNEADRQETLRQSAALPRRQYDSEDGTGDLKGRVSRSTMSRDPVDKRTDVLFSQAQAGGRGKRDTGGLYCFRMEALSAAARGSDSELPSESFR
ncbi:Hypothetical protein NTJ_09654 [Nesidiocoris tenuis]|uniref:Uncharacterized protein n=1 Tax=Nesidiocoris tenuis TaxID=355587 RepID=A0ABN7B0W0_9HEMI|nr:Hypothetical protein NTJ_09654 [Nesidiocoris tenuis]